MFLSARCQVMMILICAAIFLVACEAADATPTPRPTWTPRTGPTLQIPMLEPEETPMLTSLPLPSTTEQPITTTQTTTQSVGAPRVAAPIPPAAGNDPLLPKFGKFPPVPVPNRPANINPLTGLTADPALLQRRPIVARIGNDQSVRTSFWQAGTTSAELVFEELIDVLGSRYAMTRLSAVFLSNDPPLIGPIRSGRIINFQVVPMLDSALAHSGGSNGTRWLFQQSPMVNLDEYLGNMPAYCYDKTHGYQGRLFTTGPRLREWLRSKGWEAPVPLYGFTFSDRAPGGSPVTTISLTKAPWPAWSQATWKYDAASGKYLRWSTGEPHMDTSHSVTAKWGSGADCIITSKDTQSQISAANIVVLYARHEKTNIIEDENNYVSVYIPLTGQGDALFLRDGVMVQGKWQRRSEQEFFQFTDTAGNGLALKPGNTWFEIVPIGYQLDLK